MGVNNKARRARKRRQPVGASGRPRFDDKGSRAPGESPLGDAERAARLLSEALTEVRYGLAPATEQATRLMLGIPRRHLTTVLRQALTDVTVAVLRHGWTPSDLGEITRRRLTTRHIALVAMLVMEETQRHPAATVSPAWQDELDGLGECSAGDLTDETAVAQALELICLFGQLPPLAQSTPPPGSPPGTFRIGEGAEHRMLTKVRALLAKAESTEFPEESEALTAKAQELISAYALDELAAQAYAGSPGEQLIVRRIWLDAPYVSAKSMLVHAVAEANHCSSVFSKGLGFVTLVGRPTDVDATELLITSLLVQADRAMLLYPGRNGSSAPSRTASFRRAFLISYADRIGERLRDSAADSLATSGRSSELVPVLAQVDEQVQAATDQLFPNLVERSVRISNAQGWAAGRAAADLAVFNVHGQLAEEAAS
jgi:hypothetical protein